MRRSINYHKISIFLPGIAFRNYYIHPGILEIECSGRRLPVSVDVSSMKLFTHVTNETMAMVFPTKNTCKTFTYFSSCHINVVHTRKSSLKALVTDVAAGETVMVGCNVSVFNQNGEIRMYSWLRSVLRQSKNVNTLRCFPL